MEVVLKFLLFEYLEVLYCLLLEEDFLKVVGQFCFNLKILKLNSEFQFKCDDDEVLVIVEIMFGLCYFQFCGNGLINKGLNVIFDVCLYLVYFDLCKCFCVDFDGDMVK